MDFKGFITPVCLSSDTWSWISLRHVKFINPEADAVGALPLSTWPT